MPPSLHVNNPKTEPLQKRTFVAIDFESTLCPKAKTSIPTQIGIVQARAGEILPHTFFSSDLKTEKQPQHPCLLELWPQLEPQLRGHYLVAHGRGTEKRFLRAFPFHRLGPWIDTLLLSRQRLPNLCSYQLSEVIMHLGLMPQLLAMHPNFRWHDALSDALAALALCHNLLFDDKN